jgi:hypothetical protein
LARGALAEGPLHCRRLPLTARLTPDPRHLVCPVTTEGVVTYDARLDE